MWQPLAELLWQDHCVACAVLLPPGRAFCDGCDPSANRLVTSETCPVCMDVDAPGLCARCKESPPPFERVVAGLEWGGAVRDAVHRLKFGDAPWVAAPLMRHAHPDVRALPACDAIVPVPLHSRRHRERGYNQARLLAEDLALRMEVPLARDVLTRAVATRAVAELPPSERADAVKGAFLVENPGRVQGRRVMLVDDVVTTSSTVREVCRVLREAGATSIIVVSVARGGSVLV